MNTAAPFKGPDQLSSARLAAIHRVWKDIAGDREAPTRAEITPARVRALIASTWIMDVIDGGTDFRFRFAGDRIIQFMGRRYAGTLLSNVRGNPFFDGMHALLATCAAQRAPFAVGPMRSAHAGKEHLEFEALALPLADQGGEINALFGGFDTWPLGTHLSAKR